MVASMPKGPKYVDFTITKRTGVDDFSSFLQRAELASVAEKEEEDDKHATEDYAETGAQRNTRQPPFSLKKARQTTVSPSPPRVLSTAPNIATRSAADYASHENHHTNHVATARRSPISHHGAPRHTHLVQRPVVVVCLYGIVAASAPVMSVLMEVLTRGTVSMGGTTQPVPSLRLVAFCDYRLYAVLLPESVRAAFALSTFVSTLAMSSAAVLQNADLMTSSVINKRNMLEVMHPIDGVPLIETVTIASAVERYLRHLLLVLCGSLSGSAATGTMLLQRMLHFTMLIKVAALLFVPEDTSALPVPAYAIHANVLSLSPRSAGLVSNTSQTLSTTVGTMPLEDGSAGAAVMHSLPRVLSFAHVVVSPSDVVCLLPALVTHVLTLSREAVPAPDILAVLRSPLPGSVGNSIPAQIYTSEPDTAEHGTWDVNVTTQRAIPTMRPLLDRSVQMLDYSLMLDTSLQLSIGPNGMRNRPVTPSSFALHGNADRGNGRTGTVNGVLPLSPSDLRAATSPAMTALRPGAILNSFLPRVLKTLNYTEVKEVVRATIVARSAPAPG